LKVISGTVNGFIVCISAYSIQLNIIYEVSYNGRTAYVTAIIFCCEILLEELLWCWVQSVSDG